MLKARREDEIKLARYLLNSTLGKLSGKSEDICYGERPRNKYFTGSLANEPFQESGNLPDDDFFSRLAPTAMGLDFMLKKNDKSPVIIIKSDFNVYYRIFPELKRQRYISNYRDREIDEEENIQPEERKKAEWAIVYKKVEIHSEPFEVPIPQDIQNRTMVNTEEIKTALMEKISAVQRQIKEDPLCYRDNRTLQSEMERALESNEDYNRLLGKAGEEGEPVVPQWNIRIDIQIRSCEDGLFRASVILRNISPHDPAESCLTDHYIFDCSLEIKSKNREVYPFIFEILPEDYRYDRELWGLGRNCCVEKKGENTLVTLNVPVYEQPVYTTRDAVIPELRIATFDGLAKEPLQILSNIEKAMISYCKDWEDLIEKNKTELEWTEEIINAAEKDRGNFINEIKHFNRGVELLKKYDILCEAFRLMNKTFSRASKGYTSWRLFQLVYIVTQIPAISSREYGEEDIDEMDFVDVLWFPTGGGKTEAYLGLIVFTAFFDRLRGKKAGITAWMRFPLRLLSLQQLQRLADITGAAELLRRNTKLINNPDDEPFTIAYLVGSGNTPNKLTDYTGNGKISWLERFTQKPDLMEDFLTIPLCPFCGKKSVKMSLKKDEIRLVHICTNPDCQEDVLPIFIVDNEIYRYLPTVIAGTVDKVTAAGYERKFSHLFGGVSHRCPLHGYLSMGECTEKYGCKLKNSSFKPVKIKDPSPTLQIQDELHLLREELGAFDGHYETFIDTYQQHVQNKRQKIVAATATIEEYKNQITHLYARKARRFPVPGPELGESFYATTLKNDTRRLFAGIMPHNYTHINAIVRLAQLHHMTIEDLQKKPLEAISMLSLKSVSTSEEFLNILSNYEVFVTYLLSKREGDRLNQSFEGQLNRELGSAGYTEIINRTVIGETPFSEVRKILDELEEPAPDFADRLRSLTATSTISHGVDVERLNTLCLFGMPRQTAEYIQVTSRAGRDHPGIVFVCFNPSRERDQSHYHFFNKYQEFRDRLVEPVPINRWSKFSIKRTIPGLFMAILLNDYNLKFGGGGKDSLYFTQKVRQLIEDNTIKENEIIKYLIEAYRTENKNEGRDFEIFIREKINQYIRFLGVSTEDFTSGSLPDSPMQSLRDIDEQLEIHLERKSSNILYNSGRRSRQ